MKSLIMYNLLHTADLITTKLGLDMGIKDLNPLINSSPFWIIGKISLMIGTSIFFYYGFKKTRVTKYVLLVLSIIICLGVINNIIQISG